MHNYIEFDAIFAAFPDITMLFMCSFYAFFVHFCFFFDVGIQPSDVELDISFKKPEKPIKRKKNREKTNKKHRLRLGRMAE